MLLAVKWWVGWTSVLNSNLKHSNYFILCKDFTGICQSSVAILRQVVHIPTHLAIHAQKCETSSPLLFGARRALRGRQKQWIEINVEKEKEKKS